jgi:toxin ParE1/3/4
VAKKHRVEISKAAQADADAIRDYIALDKPAAAQKRSRRLVRRMLSLRSHPLRHEIIPEAREINRNYRHMLFGKYRIIYHVGDDRVVVLRVIHSARLLDESMFP